MKRPFIAVALMFAASAAFAGLTYKTQSTTTGVRTATIAGTVSIDGGHLRFDVAQGDNMMFKNNGIVLSSDGGKTMTVFDPPSKTYYELHLDQLLGNATSALGALGNMVKVSFDNPQVSVRDAGDGGTVEGFPTHKYVLTAAYDVNVDAMGQKMTSHLTMDTESWNTEQLSAEMTFLQMRGLRTGVENLDKLIEAQSSIMHGFPMKQVSTIHIHQGDSDVVMTTTSSVTEVEKKNIAPSLFDAPSGYTKVDDPVTTMMKSIKQ